MKTMNGVVPINFHLKGLLFNLLHSSKNQELFEKHLNHSSHYENIGDFRYAKEATTCTTKSTLFAVN